MCKNLHNPELGEHAHQRLTDLPSRKTQDRSLQLPLTKSTSLLWVLGARAVGQDQSDQPVPGLGGQQLSYC